VCSALGVDAGVVDYDARARGESRFCVLAAHSHLCPVLCVTSIHVYKFYATISIKIFRPQNSDIRTALKPSHNDNITSIFDVGLSPCPAESGHLKSRHFKSRHPCGISDFAATMMRATPLHVAHTHASHPRAMSNPLEERFSRSWVDHLSRLREVEATIPPEVEGDPALRYSVPRIVCIGEESSGKSSTLERVAMMSVFPSDERLCTRVPIELRLRHRDQESLAKEDERFRDGGYVVMRMVPGVGSKLAADVSSQMHPDDVPAQVRTWMERLVEAANGAVTGVTDDRIIIELYSPLCVNLDLIDLPGIVAGSIPGEPTDMMDRTRNLSASFLNDETHPHTFVIAVASAREARIRNSQAMELVQRYNKVQFTIGALTMADLSADTRRESPYTRLIERVNAEADDTPELGLGYVALKNRDTVTASRAQSREELERANQDEKEWFAEYLPGHSDRCGIESLVDRLVQKVDEYTRGPWIVAERKRIETECIKVRQELNEMGEFVPNDLTELISYFSSEVEKWCEPSIETVLEFVPTLTSGSVGLPDIYDTTKMTCWQEKDIESLNPPRPNPGMNYQVDPDSLKKFDAKMFDIERSLLIKSWSSFVPIAHKDLFVQDTQAHLFVRDTVPGASSPTSSNSTWTVRNDAMNTISNYFKQQPSGRGSLLFVGRYCSNDDDCHKLVGFFVTENMTSRGHEIQTMLTALGKHVPTNDRSSSQTPQSPNNVGAGIPFGFYGFGPIPSTSSGRPIRRARRPPKLHKSLQGKHNEVILMQLSGRPVLRAQVQRTEDLEKYYDDALQLRKYVVKMCQTNARAFFKSLTASVLDSVKTKDARFSVFFETLSFALGDWCEERVQGATDRFVEFIDRTRAVFENRDTYFQITSSYFTNALTRMLRDIIFFQCADSSIVDLFKSGKLNELLRRHCREHEINVDDLYVEDCVEQRKKALLKMETLITMKNKLQEIFTSEADARTSERSPTTPEADTPPAKTLSHSLSRTSI